MIQLQDSISLLKNFKQKFGDTYGITKLGIFGSVARGENTEDSDIDIVVEVKSPSFVLMHDLREALSSLFNFYGHYAYRPDAVLAACKQERHAVALVDFPAAFGNVEQPSFGN